MSSHKLVVDVVIKFGGSAISDKNKLETLRPQQLTAAAKCVRCCTDAGLSCIVVHGAGSFGHHQAKEYKVNTGLKDVNRKEDEERKLWGFCVTRQSVVKLNQSVISCLIEAGVPAIACSPCSSWETDDRQPVKWPSDTISGLLARGLVPVLHGDSCLDASLGCCILSGDTIIEMLCSFFTVRRVVFLTDVAGVYDKPPEQPGAKLLKTITVGPDGTADGPISVSQSQHDVTGGIMLKLKTAIAIVVKSQGQCPVFICSVDSPDASLVCLDPRGQKDLNLTTICLAMKDEECEIADM